MGVEDSMDEENYLALQEAADRYGLNYHQLYKCTAGA
jgi:hypothetical protein